jgi:membrane protease YdiL (CAAX protease family)
LLKPQGWLDAGSTQIVDKVRGFGVGTFWSYAALAAFYSLFHSGLEEYYWRWFVFRQLRQRVSPMPAILISSLGFMAHHVIVLGFYFGWSNPLAYVLSLSVAVGGAFWAWLYERTNSLTGPWLSHMLVDAAIFVVGYDIVRHTL